MSGAAAEPLSGSPSEKPEKWRAGLQTTDKMLHETTPLTTADDWKDYLARLEAATTSLAQLATADGSSSASNASRAASAATACVRRQAAQVETRQKMASLEKQVIELRNAASSAPTVDEAKAAATRAHDVAAEATRVASTYAADSDVAVVAGRIAKEAKVAAANAATKEAIDGSLCGLTDLGSARHVCGVYGLFSATLSRVQPMSSDAFGGATQRKLTSLAVPFAAARVVPSPDRAGYVGFEIGLYSAFLTKGLAPTHPDVDKKSCSTATRGFESRLPCEADAELFPFAAAYAAITVGRSGLAYISVVPYTVGLAQVGSSTAVRWFSGSMLGLLQLNGKF